MKKKVINLIDGFLFSLEYDTINYDFKRDKEGFYKLELSSKDIACNDIIIITRLENENSLIKLELITKLVKSFNPKKISLFIPYLVGPLKSIQDVYPSIYSIMADRINNLDFDNVYTFAPIANYISKGLRKINIFKEQIFIRKAFDKLYNNTKDEIGIIFIKKSDKEAENLSNHLDAYNYDILNLSNICTYNKRGEIIHCTMVDRMIPDKICIYSGHITDGEDELILLDELVNINLGCEINVITPHCTFRGGTANLETEADSLVTTDSVFTLKEIKSKRLESIINLEFTSFLNLNYIS